MGRPSVERIVGKLSAAEKENLVRAYDEQFDDQAFEALVGKERKATPEELRIIALANIVTNGLRNEFGLGNLDIPWQNVHIVKEEEWPSRRRESAIYMSSLQAVVLREGDSKLVLLATILHEMVHFKSYNAAQVTKSEAPELLEYRVGLRMSTRDGETTHFRNLNEAVTEQITIELMSRVLHDRIFEKEIRQTKDLGTRYSDAKTANGELLFDDDTYYARFVDKTTLKDRVAHFLGKEQFRDILISKFPYPQERRILNILIAKLVDHNPQRFQHNGDDVRALFTKSMMTGNLLPIGRLVDGTFGRGTLRKIGELDGDINAQEELVKSL